MGTLAVRVAGRVLAFATAVLLGRLLGADGYGVYAYALAIVSLLSIFTRFGLSALLVREVATYDAGEEWGRLRGVLLRSNQVVAVLSVTAAAIGAWVVWLLADRLSAAESATLSVAMLLVPLGALGALRSGTLRGLRRVVQGQLPDQVIDPAFVVLSLVALTGLGGAVTPATAMALRVGGVFLAFSWGAILLRRHLPQPVREARPVYEDRRWLSGALGLGLFSSGEILHTQTDILVLGLFTDEAAVGVYRVAVTGAALVAFFQEVATNLLQPHFARMHGVEDTEELQRVVTRGTRAAFLATVPVAGVFVFAGGSVLAFAFGPEFAPGWAPLAILSVGRILAVALGPVGPLLNMTGHEREAARALGGSAVVNLVLSVALVPVLGTVGAATATALTFLGLRIHFWRRVRILVGVDSSLFPGVAPPGRRP